MLRIGDPIATAGMSLRQTDELTAELRVAIGKLLDGTEADEFKSVETEVAGT
jgi:hypothetical protein